MRELVELFLSLGYSDVSSYIQSGNVVFRACDADPAGLEAAIKDRFALDTRVMLRTHDGARGDRRRCAVRPAAAHRLPRPRAGLARRSRGSTRTARRATASESPAGRSTSALRERRRAHEADARLVRARARRRRDAAQLEHAAQADRPDGCASGRLRPPTRSATRSKPERRRMLAAVAERYPLEQWTTIGRSRGSSSRWSSSRESGMFTLPSTASSPTSSSARTSRTNGGSGSVSCSASVAAVMRSVRSTSSGRLSGGQHSAFEIARDVVEADPPEPRRRLHDPIRCADDDDRSLVIEERA